MDYPIQIVGQLRPHLQSLRRTKGLTQAQLGKLLGVGQVRIAEIEKNPAAISAEQLIRILAALDMQVVLRHAPRADSARSAKSDNAQNVW